jgi:hypothetical protein
MQFAYPKLKDLSCVFPICLAVIAFFKCKTKDIEIYIIKKNNI